MADSTADVTSTEFIADPTGHMFAVLDDRELAEHAVADLQNAGFEEVRIYEGYRGASALDSEGTQHGVPEHLVRLVQQAFSNKDNLAEYEQEAMDGAIVLSLKVDSAACRKEAALTILDRAGARAVNSYGSAMVETLRP